jgi:hypothetical protein
VYSTRGWKGISKTWVGGREKKVDGVKKQGNKFDFRQDEERTGKGKEP